MLLCLVVHHEALLSGSTVEVGIVVIIGVDRRFPCEASYYICQASLLPLLVCVMCLECSLFGLHYTGFIWLPVSPGYHVGRYRCIQNIICSIRICTYVYSYVRISLL